MTFRLANTDTSTGMSSGGSRRLGVPSLLATFGISLAILALPCRGQEGDRSPHLCIDTGGHTAPIQALAFTADSQYVCSAGLDKAVRVWGVSALTAPGSGDRARSIIREEDEREVSLLRWEVGRGQRGNIHALAISPTGQLVIGGFGARGTLGDLAWLEVDTGQWLQSRHEHRQPVTALAWTSQGRWLVSQDRGGTTLVWPASAQGQAPRSIQSSDEARLGAETARSIAAQLRYRPLTLLDDTSVVLPYYGGTSNSGTPQWKLRQLRLADGQFERDLGDPLPHAVLALAASRDGRWVAAADGARRLLLYDRQRPTAPGTVLAETHSVLSLAFHPDGGTLVAGTAEAVEGEGAELQIWDVAERKLRRARPLPEPVYACAISPDGEKLAYVGGPGHDVHLERLDDPAVRVTFAGGRQIVAVGLPPGEGAPHALAFREEPAAADTTGNRIFDPARLEIREVPQPPPGSALRLGDWSAELDFAGNRVALFHERRPVGHLQLDRAAHGLLSCCAWIPDAQGSVVALAVGTNIQNGVFVFAVSPQGPGALLRYFRGHQDRVQSLVVTPDRRYLVSGARDGLLIYWRLEGVLEAATVPRRWGARLVQRGGRVTVESLDDLGPLYQKGVRAGDSIDALLWVEQGQTRQQRDPGEIPRTLERLAWDQQVAFLTSRAGESRPPFNLFGAWYPLLSVFVTSRDWIAWASSGYYACSPGGERLIGWQVNNALGQAPSFYAAERFSKTLYRPDVIRALLETGGLERTLARRDERATEVAEIRPPRVQIVTPSTRRVSAQTRRVEVTAVAQAETDAPVESLTLLLNGRPYQRKSPGDPQVTRRGERDLQASWSLELTPGEHRVGVRADNARTQGTDEIVVQCTAGGEKQALLRVLAVGVSDYPGDLRLEYGHSDAQAFATTLKEQSRELFQGVEVRLLTDAAATREGIRAGLEWLRQNTRWPDVAVLYFSGHGVNDGDGKFYLLPQDGAARRLAETAVAEEEIKEFCAHTPGKILVLLDACHSGGIQINVNDLARELGRNEYGVIVMSSSRGDEVARENRLWGGGAFTRALVDGLNGAADLRRKGYVLTPVDLDPYVYYTVRELTQGRQTPISNKSSVAPFPLTRTRPAP